MTKDEDPFCLVISSTLTHLISIVSCPRPDEAVVVVQMGHILNNESGEIEATDTHEMMIQLLEYRSKGAVLNPSGLTGQLLAFINR